MAANPSFPMYLTHIDGGPTFIRLSGQRDKSGAMMVETLIDKSTYNFDKGIGVTTAASLCDGLVCVAKYSKDNRYYRAKILNPNYHHEVYVHFIDYGNKELVSIDSIRLLDLYPPSLSSIVAQAKDFILARLITPPGTWNESVNAKLYDMVCNADYMFKVEKQAANESFISFMFSGNDFAEHLARSGYGVRIEVEQQEEILLGTIGTNINRAATTVFNFPPMFPQLNQPPPPFQSVQPVLPQLNPAYGHNLVVQKQNAMVQQALAISSPQTVGIFNKLAKNIVSPRPLNRSASGGGQVIDRSLAQRTEAAVSPLKVKSPRSKSTYKTKSLEINSEHQVYVSYSEDGPKIFAIQLESTKDQLQSMMAAINKLPLQTLTDLPSIGSVCLGRISEDKVMCRAVVMGSYDQQCNLFFVDFGITEMVSYYDIFDIPEEYVKPNVFALRFCLSGIKELSLSKELIKTFKELVNNTQLLLKVVPPEGPPLIQYGELYINGRNLKDILKESCPPTQYKFERPQPLSIDTDHSVLVCFVDSCTNFYVQLSDKIDALNTVMNEVDHHCKNSEKMEINSLKKDSACCALFPFDLKWYRAQVESVDGNNVNVRYIDYGNEQDVTFESIRPITPKLLKLKPQAIRCTLKGYEGQPEKKTASNQLEMLSLEKTLKAHIFQLLEDGSLLVGLLDESINPPLDIARRMSELSKPRQSRTSLDSTENQVKPIKAVSAQDDVFDEAPKIEKLSYERSDRQKYDRQEKPKSDRSERGERTGRSDRTERFDRTERSGRPDRGERSERGDRTERDERSDRGERSGRLDRSERGDRSERPKKDWDTSKSDWPKNDFETSRGDKPRRDRDFNSSKSDWPKKDDSNWPKKDFDSSRFERPRRDFDSGKSDRPKRDFDSTNTFRSNDDFKGRTYRENPGRFEKTHRNNESNETATDSWGQNDNERKKSLRKRNKSDNVSRRDNNERSRNLQPANERLTRVRSGYTEWGSNSNNSDKSSESSARPDRGTKDRGDQPSFKTSRSDYQPRTPRDNNRGNSNRRETGGGWDDKGQEATGGWEDNRRETGGKWDNNRGDYKRSEKKSFSDAGSDKSFDNSHKTRSRFTIQTEVKTLPNPATLDVQFLSHEIELLSQHEISIPWFVSPHQFFIQLVSFQQQFSTMMYNIPDLYKGIKAYGSNLYVNSTIMARFPEDRVLYRATIIEVKPMDKYLVQFVDFGNVCEVDSKNIWQADSDLLTLPKMAILCKLDGIAPVAESWPSNSDFESCFNAPRYQCIFHSLDDGVYTVSLYNNSVSVAQMLIERNLAISADSALSAILKDEPIDLNMIVSQNLYSKVSHVASLEKFFLQLDPSKAAVVEEAMSSYQLEKNLPPERLIDGCHCIVKTEDDKIYRAILIDTSDKSNIKMALPDVGREITTASENVMTLPDDLTVYYYQSLECSLHNFVKGSRETLMTEEKFKEKLQDESFIVYIDDVIDGRLEVTLYDKDNGAKLEIFTPDEGAHLVVPVPCPHPVFNENFGVAFVSHVESLNEIYLQKFTSSNTITTLLDSLFEHYDIEEGKMEALSDIDTESVCAAKSSDGNWYRAIVKEHNEENCQVQFIDYGNSETVPLSDVKKLDAKFSYPHQLALQVTLGLESLNEESVSKLIEWTNNKNVQVTLIPGEEWQVTLYVDGIDIGVKLVSENLAVSQHVLNEVHDLDQNKEESGRTPGSTLVYITHIDTPGQFWLQLDSDNIDVANLQAHLQEISETLPNLENVDTGILAVAKYSADEQWYRAEILDSDNEIITVRFIDYGNTDVLDNVPGLIKELPKELGVKERFALKCSVNATPTGTGQWTEPASDLFTLSIGNLDDPVDALIILKDITTYVDLYVNGKNVTDILVSNGFASKSDREESGGMATCFASHINTPSEFWVQLESSIPELQLIENEMTAAENFPPLSDKEEGVICAAKYPEDELWYRAQIIINGSNGTEVLFMDYGNASLTTELRTLPEYLKAKPALSRKCALQKPGNLKMWPQLAEQKFSELAADGATIFSVQFIASGDISIVELYLNEMSVTDELVSLCEGPLNTADRPSPIGQDSLAKGSVISAVSPNNFYLRLEEDILNLENVTTTLLDAENGNKVDNIEIGQVYAALWSEDNEWYRAKILNKLENFEYEVFFIDFGNKAICKEFRLIPEDIVYIKPLILHCKISVGDDDVCNSDLIMEFEELTNGGDMVFDVEILDSDSEPILIKLFLDGKNVVTKLKTTKSETKQSDEDDDLPECKISAIDEPEVSIMKDMQDLNLSGAEEVDSENLVENLLERQNVSTDLNHEINNSLQVNELSLNKQNDTDRSLKKSIKTEARNVSKLETNVSPTDSDNDTSFNDIKYEKSDNIDNEETQEKKLVLNQVSSNENIGDTSLNEREVQNSNNIDSDETLVKQAKTLEMQDETVALDQISSKEKDKKIMSSDENIRNSDLTETEETVKEQIKEVNQVSLNKNGIELNDTITESLNDIESNETLESQAEIRDDTESDKALEAQIENLLLNQGSPKSDEVLTLKKAEIEKEVKFESNDKQNPKTDEN